MSSDIKYPEIEFSTLHICKTTFLTVIIRREKEVMQIYSKRTKTLHSYLLKTKYEKKGSTQELDFILATNDSHK